MLVKRIILALLLTLLPSLTTKADFVVAFGAKWCGPCRAMKPTEDKLIQAKYRIYQVDVDEREDLKLAYRVYRLPTLVYVAETSQGNIEMDRVTGYQTEEQIKYFCRPHPVITNPAPVANAVRSVLGLPLILGQ